MRFKKLTLQGKRQVDCTMNHFIMELFIKYFFVNASVIFQHESVIRVGNQQNIENPPCHQIGDYYLLPIINFIKKMIANEI